MGESLTHVTCVKGEQIWNKARLSPLVVWRPTKRTTTHRNTSKLSVTIKSLTFQLIHPLSSSSCFVVGHAHLSLTFAHPSLAASPSLSQLSTRVALYTRFPSSLWLWLANIMLIYTVVTAVPGFCFRATPE